MAHALTPGHGKAMIAAYLAGTRGTARHAFALGATVTVTHTAGVFALGLVTLSLSQFIVPETLYPWLNLTSGVLVLAIGLYAIRDRLRRWLRGRAQRAGAGHGHGRHHHHDHDGDHGHSHDADQHALTTTTRTAATATPTRTAATRTRMQPPDEPPGARCSRSASPAGSSPVRLRSSCCSRRSRCTRWRSGWR